MGTRSQFSLFHNFSLIVMLFLQRLAKSRRRLLAQIALESPALRRSARNRYPIRGGTYGTYGADAVNFGWTGIP